MNYRNTEKELRLAREYKHLLTSIRPLIEQLDKSEDARLCLLWLSKLDKSSQYERNDILSELSRQVKNKRLEPPFNREPPQGPLRNISLKTSVPLWRSNDFSDDISSDITTTETTAPRSPGYNSSGAGGGGAIPVRSSSAAAAAAAAAALLDGGNRSPAWRGKYTQKSMPCVNVAKDFKPDHSRCVALQQKYQERVLNDQLLITCYQDIIKSLMTKKLKDPDSVKVKSLKSTYENKIHDLTSSLKMYEEENNSLKQKLSDAAIPVEKLQEVQAKNAELKEKLGHLEVANNILELKCRELELEKNSNASELSNKLMEAEKRLKEAEGHLKSAEKKFADNLWAARAEHQEEMNELEKKYTCELSTLERLLEEKQSEIKSLRDQVSSQCRHFEAEVLRLKQDLLQDPDLDKEKRKVKFLKSQLKKLEKGQESMALAFQTQLHQIVSKKDLLISTLEMRIKAKDTDSIASGQPVGLDSLVTEKVSHLESQYRKLLEESENQAAARRQMDLQKILNLEKQLVDSGVELMQTGNLMLTGPNSDTAQVLYTAETGELQGKQEACVKI